MAETTNTNFRKHPQYKLQMNHLSELITEGQTGTGKFVVLGIEAGCFLQVKIPHFCK